MSKFVPQSLILVLVFFLIYYSSNQCLCSYTHFVVHSNLVCGNRPLHYHNSRRNPCIKPEALPLSFSPGSFCLVVHRDLCFKLALTRFLPAICHKWNVISTCCSTNLCNCPPASDEPIAVDPCAEGGMAILCQKICEIFRILSRCTIIERYHDVALLWLYDCTIIAGCAVEERSTRVSNSVSDMSN